MMSMDEDGSHAGIRLDGSRRRGFLQGLSGGDQFVAYLNDTFDGLYAVRNTPLRRGQSACTVGSSAAEAGQRRWRAFSSVDSSTNRV